MPKCNWCHKGDKRTYVRKDGVNYYYYCQECVGTWNVELSGASQLIEYLKANHLYPEDSYDNCINMIEKYFQEKREDELNKYYPCKEGKHDFQIIDSKLRLEKCIHCSYTRNFKGLTLGESSNEKKEGYYYIPELNDHKERDS